MSACSMIHRLPYADLLPVQVSSSESVQGREEAPKGHDQATTQQSGVHRVLQEREVDEEGVRVLSQPYAERGNFR